MRKTFFITLASLTMVANHAPGVIPATLDLVSGSPDIVVWGADINDGLTGVRWSINKGVFLADVSGDGIKDLVASAATADGSNNFRNASGEVYIWYGDGSWDSVLDVTGVLGPAPDLVIYGTSTRNFGDGIGVIDMNADGNLDLFVREYFSWGTINFFFGPITATGTIDLHAGATPDASIRGAASFDHIGGEIFQADLNGDGFGDMIFSDIQTTAAAGTAGRNYVILARPTFAGSYILNTGTAWSTRVLGAEPLDLIFIRDTGDVNGDGRADMFFTGWLADGPGNTRNSAGECYLIFGKSTFTDTDISIAAHEYNVRFDGAEAGDTLGRYFGGALADVNGDGIEDVILGAGGADGPANARDLCGEVYIFFGGTSWSHKDLATATPNVTIIGPRADTSFGTMIESSDWNGDGFEDLAISAPLYDGPGNDRANCGGLFFFEGRATWPAVIDLSTTAPDMLVYGAVAGESFVEWNTRKPVTFSDVNGDGSPEVLIHHFKYDGVGGTRTDSGKVHIFDGLSLPATVDLANPIAGISTIYGASPSDFFGDPNQIRPFDFNGDGVSDLILATGAGDGPSNSVMSAGEFYVFFGEVLSTTASRTVFTAAGNAMKEELPELRTTVDFNSGAASSQTDIELVRNDSALVGIPGGGVVTADVHWNLTTNRSGFSAEVTFSYLDSEIVGLNESALTLYKAPDPSGPWSQVPSQSLDTLNNTITGTVTSFSSFALVDTSTTVKEWYLLD